VEEGRLAGIVEAEEQELGALVVEAKIREGVEEPVAERRGWGGESHEVVCKRQVCEGFVNM
jgi:hypothetical protein